MKEITLFKNGMCGKGCDDCPGDLIDYKPLGTAEGWYFFNFSHVNIILHSEAALSNNIFVEKDGEVILNPLLEKQTSAGIQN